jgi:hypothetical protein
MGPAEAQGDTLDPEAVLVMEEVSLEEAGCGDHAWLDAALEPNKED